MNTRRLFLVGLSLLIIGTLSFLTTALLKPQPRSLSSVLVGRSLFRGGGGSTSIADAPFSSLVIETNWPTQMDINTSDTISIILALNTHGTSLSLADTGDHHSTQATPTTVGDPNASLSQAFGLGYQAFAIANLVTTTFDSKLLGPQEQSPTQTAIEWSWNISPKSLGTQIVDANIEIQWTPLQPKNSPLPVILAQVWQTPIEINVTNTWLNVGLLGSTQIAGFLGVFGGIGLTVPWVWDRASEFIIRRRKKKVNNSEQEDAEKKGSSKEKEITTPQDLVKP